LWWGSLGALGFVFVPVLFSVMATPALAGTTAARLFTAQTWISTGCGLLLLLFSKANQPEQRASWASSAMVFIVGGLLLALLAEFGVAPRIIARENLALWHSVGSGMYLLQWLCAGAVLWKVAGFEGPTPRA
jgi:Domain of unknown function (DUF4149)